MPSRASIAAAAPARRHAWNVPDPSAGSRSGSSTATRNSGLWCGPAARHLAVDRRRHPAALRPFLQCGLGIAQRARRRAASVRARTVRRTPRRPHSRRRGTPPRSRPRTRRRGSWSAAAARRSAPPSRRGASPRRGRGARATSAQVSLRTRSASRRESSPSLAVREGAEQHLGDGQAEHVVAQELEPLVAAGRIARALQRPRHGSAHARARLMSLKR